MSDQREPLEVDVVVVGGGPGGEGTALYGASSGLRMALVEKDKVGGTCLHRGCIPAKRLLETASVRRAIEESARFGFTIGDVKLDYASSVQQKQEVVDRLHSGLSGTLSRKKVDVLDGVGRLEADHRTVTVTHSDGSTSQVRAGSVVIATGSVPRTIPGFEVDGEIVMTSDEVLEMTSIPGRVAVIGGGAIGCEFASMLADLGSEVTVLEALDQIVPGCDEDVVRALGRAFSKRGVTVRTGVKVTGHEPRDGGGTKVLIETDSGEESLKVDVVVVSVGRRPYTEGLLADGTSVQIDDRGFVVVDELCRTGVPGVYAVGDVVDTPALAHVGYAEGQVVVKDILGESPVPVAYHRVPWAIYCHPEIAFAGLTEQQARDAGYEVVVGKHRFTANSRAQLIDDTEGLVKVIAEAGPDGRAGQILGVHMMGPWVTEQLGQGYLSVNWEATADEVAAFIQPHPTLSELFGETVLGLTGRGMHS